MFTTEHYVVISKIITHQVIRGQRQAFAGNLDFALGIHSAAETIAGELADTFGADDNNFRRDLFFEACGLDK